MLNNKQPIVDWDGKQSRDFTYVYNIAEANIKAATQKGISGEVFNIACGNSISVIEIVGMLNKILGKRLKPKYAPKRPGDVRKSYADITKMKDLLKSRPKIDFEEGLRRTTEWFVKNQDRLITI